jgi:hypothetical protein
MKRDHVAWISIRLFAVLGIIPLAASFLLAARVRADPGPIAEEAFWRMFAGTRALVSAWPGMPEDEACRSAQSEADQWEDVQAVQLPSGAVVPVRADWLVAELNRCPPDSDLLLVRMDALLDAYGRAAEGGGLSSIDTKSLSEILSQEEFQTAPKSTDAGISLQELIESLAAWLRDVADRLGRPQGLVWGLGLCAVILLSGILLLAWRLFRRNVVPSAATGPAGGQAEAMLTSDRAAGLAEERFAAGNKRQAIRYLYLSALLFLEEHGHISSNRSLTDQEYIRSIVHLPHLAVPLRKAVAVFDRVWYGFQIPTEKEYREYKETVTEIRRRS